MQYILTKLGIDCLNPMQEDMLREYRKHRKLVLLSPTGSGKTLAYLLPLVESLDESSSSLQSIVLVPSRELAIQTNTVLRQLSPFIRSMACYGGRPTMDEHRRLRVLEPQVLVATPGRMLDHIQKGNLLLSAVHTMVIDEFDKSLELGFQQQMQDILSFLPFVEHRILLSATDSPEIPTYVGHDFYKLSYLEEMEQIPDRIRLFELRSPEKDKLATLYRLLCHLGQQTSLVFVNYRESVERVGEYLRKMGIAAEIFHGGLEQRDRERALYKLYNGSCNVFVSTDLAARGLDIPGIDNIIHYHLPLNEKAYIHRNGRTARWDAEGCSCLLLGPEEHCPEYLQDEPTRLVLPSRLPSPSQPRWATIYIGKGKKDKVNKIDIVGFFSKVGGLGREELGRIDVLPSWAYAAVDRRVAKSLLKKVNGQKIKGQKTLFELAE